MSIPYPEGEVYFRRPALKTNAFDPENFRHFVNNALIEWAWNESDPYRQTGYDRNRQTYCSGSGGKEYWFWRQVNVMYGTKDTLLESVNGGQDSALGITVMKKLMAPDDSPDYEKRAKGGPLKVVLTPVPLNKDLPYMFIDLCAPIRAIYFPLNQNSSKSFPDLCSYLMVDFRLRQGVSMWSAPSTFTGQTPVRFDLEKGLGKRTDKILSIYIPGLYNYLVLPRQYRSADQGLYMPTDPNDAIIRLLGRFWTTRDRYSEEEIASSDSLDLAKVISSNLGVQVCWQPFDLPPPEDTLFLFKTFAEVGLGFIPCIGPLASLSFTLFVTICENVDEFKKQNPFNMSSELIDKVGSAAKDVAGMMPKLPGKVGGLIQFFQAAAQVGSKLTQKSEKETQKSEKETQFDEFNTTDENVDW